MLYRLAGNWDSWGGKGQGKFYFSCFKVGRQLKLINILREEFSRETKIGDSGWREEQQKPCTSRQEQMEAVPLGVGGWGGLREGQRHRPLEQLGAPNVGRGGEGTEASRSVDLVVRR